MARFNLDLGIFENRKITPIRQTEMSECGLACLTMISNFHGRKFDIGVLRRKFEISQRGSTLKSLMMIADNMGMASRAVKLPLERLSNLKLPAMLHWDLNHYVVLESEKRGRFLIHDPAKTSRWMEAEEVSWHFTGVALELRRSEDFIARDHRETLKLSQLWGSITGLKRTILQTLLLSAVLQLFVLVSPYYMQIAIDRALPAQDLDLLLVLAVGFGLFMLINTAAYMLRSFVLLWAGTSMGYDLATNVARHLFRLPISWFEKRHVGDVLSRFQSIKPIQELLLTGTIAAIVDGSLAVLTLVLMFFYSPSLASIALSAFVLYLVVRAISFKFERQAIEETIVAGASEQTNLIETLRGITTVRLFNTETIRHGLWQTKLAAKVNGEAKKTRVGIWQDTANKLLFGAENVLTIYFAISLVLNGGFSVGMVFAFLAYKTQFTEKTTTLVDEFILFRMLGLHLERMSDIVLAEEDVSFTGDLAVGNKFEGNITLEKIVYRYSSGEPVVLNGLDLSISAGEHIAITGPSGGGKSSLVKIVLGLDEPESGLVVIDGQPLRQFGHRSYHSQIAAVLQDDVLFAGSLADNIALFDDSPDMGHIVDCAIAAAIHDDIKGMPMQYETLVGDMGSALSGGQKQRVLIARALYRRPTLLVLDEGTAHLDEMHESAINESIGSLGITRIVVAHRRETLLAADRMYHMEKGILKPIEKRQLT